MDSLAVTYASELSGWGIESTIVSPGVFTAGTNHFDHAGKGSDDEVEAEYLQGPYSSVPERVMNGLKAGDTPGDIADVARAILDVVTAPYGKVPFRVNIDPWNDGGDTVNQVKDLARREFYYKTGLTDILHVKSRGNVL
jgi:NAD(P)-dependent dehydrogenase (short-subunit alcohol dehydrogenase family)